MDIRKLVYFDSVVRHLNFTRAAEESFISQTAISRHIASLEEEIGAPLLERDTRTVKVTEAGKVFHRHALIIMEEYQRMIEQTYELAHNKKRMLRIGFGQYEHIFVSNFVKEFAKEYFNVEIIVEQYLYKDLIRKVNEGFLDVAFSLPGGAECVERDVESIPIYPSNLSLVVPHDHRLASIETLPAHQLDSIDTLITLSESAGPCSYERLKNVLANCGIGKIKRLIPANSLASLFLMVESGLGLAFVPDFCVPNPTVHNISLENANTGDFVALYKCSPNPLLQSFMNIINQTRGNIPAWINSKNKAFKAN